MLDERLSLAASLYTPCELGADIGTDHALLPCHLLHEGTCRRMILADVSEKALAHARAQVSRQHLENRARLVLADGLDALDEPCGCVSVMGMGGESIARILARGADRLQGAALVLSAHTDLPLVRKAVQDAGYHLVREEICRAAGRYYIVWKAEPGPAAYTPQQLRLGPLMMDGAAPLLAGYLRWRCDVLEDKLRGLRAASRQDDSALQEISSDLAVCRRKLEALS